jgi:succinyl-diaminopimelate desuccinylase
VTDLLDRTAALMAVASPSRGEGVLAGQVHQELSRHPWLEVTRVGDNVVARTDLGRPMRLLLAGHLDTVPPAGNAEPRRDGESLWGVGAADMKGGLAVMLDLAGALPEPAVDVTWCFYAREEVSRAESGLEELWAARPDLLRADAAIMGEPTDAVVEAGCQGTLRAVIHVGGIRAHTARPFTGRNAIHRLGAVLGRVASWPGRTAVLEGCSYAEQLQAVAVEGGVAGNVVPDHAALTVNYRFAPDRTEAEAVGELSTLFSGVLDPSLGDSMDVVDIAGGALPSLRHPLLAALVSGSGAEPRAKVGWTDVATMATHGVPAANFGPGDPLLAHHPEERVTAEALARTRAVLAVLLSTPVA